MALRGFGGIQTLTGTAQPVYGTALTADAVINPDQYTGSIGTGSNQSTAILSVTAGTAGRFRVGDRVVIGSAAQLEQGNTTSIDGGGVIAVNAAGNTITVQGLQRSHNSGEFVALSLPVSSFSVQVISASSSVYIGEDPTVGYASTTLFQEFSAAGIFQYGESNIANVLDVSNLWINGGAGSQYIASINRV